MKSLSLMAAGLLSLAVAAPASAQFSNSQLASPPSQDVVSNPRSVISYFDEKTVGGVLGELGAVWQAGSYNGGLLLQANAGGDLVFYLTPAACKGANNTQCVGLAMTALFEGRSNVQTVMAFNDRFVFSSSGVNAEGNAYLSRYELADYGITRGNLATSILVFVAQAKQFQQELSTARQTVALEGYAEDLSAGNLNRNAIQSLTGVPPKAESAIELHQASLDAAAEQIRLLIENERLPRNKIDNVKF